MIAPPPAERKVFARGHHVPWLAELDTPCPACDRAGTLPVPASMPETACPHCEGAGWIPTSAGYALLAFIRRHMLGADV